jgi:hypothetical protein
MNAKANERGVLTWLPLVSKRRPLPAGKSCGVHTIQTVLILFWPDSPETICELQIKLSTTTAEVQCQSRPSIETRK